MPNMLDNLDVKTPSGDVVNVLLKDRTSLALATEAMGKIGDLNNLNTVDKGNLVAAINSSLLDIVTPQMFGAIGDGVNDDTQAIVAALATGKTVYFPSGIYRTTATIDIPLGANLVGQLTPLTSGNTFGATIKHDGNGNTFNVPNYHTFSIENMLIDKVNSTNGSGINIELVDGFTIRNVKVQNHNTGIRVVGCSYGIIDKCICEQNYSDGFYFGNNATLNTCQVQVTGCLSELNNGSGFHFVTQRPTMPVGIFSHNMTFANHYGGVVYQSVDANSFITGVKIEGCFLGGDDVLGCLYLDGISYPVVIDNCYFEMAGMDNNGRGYATSPSGYSNDIAVRKATGGVSITNSCICSSAESGISIGENVDVSINGCIFKNNGISQSASAAQKSDILITNGNAVINSNVFNESVNGVYVYTDNDIKIIGNIFNNTSGVTNAGTGTSIKFNIGVTDN